MRQQHQRLVICHFRLRWKESSDLEDMRLPCQEVCFSQIAIVTVGPKSVKRFPSRSETSPAAAIGALHDPDKIILDLDRAVMSEDQRSLTPK